MAGQTYITPSNTVPVLVRLASPELERLCTLVFKRYPEFEWGCFARFGWRATGRGLVLTLAHVETPNLGDLDEEVGHVAINGTVFALLSPPKTTLSRLASFIRIRRIAFLARVTSMTTWTDTMDHTSMISRLIDLM